MMVNLLLCRYLLYLVSWSPICSGVCPLKMGLPSTKSSEVHEVLTVQGGKAEYAIVTEIRMQKVL